MHETKDVMPRSMTTGLILSGGAGRRVNGQDKGLIDWQGKPLVRHVYDRLKPQVASIIISCNRNVAQYQKLTTTVADIRPGRLGPLAGIESAASVVDTDYLLVVACDIPNIPENLGARLLEPLITTPNRYDIAYALSGDRAHYLCAAIRTCRLAALSAALDRETRAVRDWFREEKTVAVKFEDNSDDFANLNHLSQINRSGA